MRTQIIQAERGYAIIYWFSKFEVLPWHEHPTPHGHSVVSGTTFLEIQHQEVQVCSADTGNLILPANVPHQIMAMEDDTVFINMMPPNEVVTPQEPPLHKEGGVMLHDGTIVYAD